MDPKDKQRLFVLFTIFGIAGLILYWSLLLKPQSSKFFTKNKEFCTVRDRVKKEDMLISNEENIKRQYENLKKQAEYLGKRLPGQDQISSLLEDFSRIAESSGVKILSIKPLEEIAGKGPGIMYSELPIIIEARAGYHQCGDFVNNLENMDRFIKITDIEVKSNERDMRHHDMKMRLVTYVLR